MATMMKADDVRGNSARLQRPADGPGFAALTIQLDHDPRWSLSAIIANEIIPRLVVAHSMDHAAVPVVPVAVAAAITGDDVEALAALALRVEADALLANVEALVERGITVEALLVDLLAPAARVLGRRWEDDRCNFVDVTMGLWRLQEAVHELAARVPPHGPVATGARHALFASMPGERHGLGATVIDDMFRREGWTTDRIDDAETSDLLHRVAEEWFDVIGLTIGGEVHIAAVASVIVALRNVSENPRVCVMVGGGVFSADADLATLVGADGTAGDASLAVQVAASLVREREALAAC